MAKLSDYELKKLGQQAVDFFEDTRDILNLGKVAHVIVDAVPAWTADNGEMAFFDGASTSTLSGKRIYVRLSSSWEVFATAPAIVPAPPEGAVQYYSGGALGGEGQFIWRTAQKHLFLNSSLVGQYTPLILANSNAFVAGNTAGSVRVQFGFANETANAAIQVGKINDYQSANASDSYISFFTQVNSSLAQRMTIGANADGNVGIGITGNNPSQALLVVNGATTIGNNDAESPAINGLHSTGPISIGDADISGNPANTPTRFVVSKTSGVSAAVEAEFIGPATFDIPFVFRFGHGTTTDRCRIQYQRNRGGTHSELRLFWNSNTTGSINLSKDSRTNLAEEDPAVIVDGVDYTVRSSTTISNNRIFTMNTSSFAVSAGTGAVITNAATLYIQGAPIVLSPGSVSVTNSYALWVDQGAVRFDGDVISGVATTQTKIGGTFFTTTAIGVSSNNTADITLIRGIIGTTSLVANTFSEGRTIRLQARGFYNTAASAPSLRWNVKLGGTTVLTTGSLNTIASVSNSAFDLTGLITCWTTGGAGTVYAQGGVFMSSANRAGEQWSMVNSGTVVINTTGANVLELTCQWGSAAVQNEVVMTHAVGELLN